MPRTLPATLEAAMDAGNFTAYIAIGKRNYTGDPPTALSGYTTLITEVLYYSYDGLELVVKYHSANLPADDGLYVGSKYYLERGVKVSGTAHTIKTASLRFDDYMVEKEIITAYFSLFSNDERPSNVAGDDTYRNVLADLNPNDYYLGTVDFKTTALNFNHWDYQFYPAGKYVILKSYQSVLPLLRQKWLLQAIDNSDDENEDEIQFYHLTSPVRDRAWGETITTAGSFDSCAWSEDLGIFVIGGTGVLAWSVNSVEWTEVAAGSTAWTCVGWSADLGIFVAISSSHIATSSDGKNWTVTTGTPGANFNSIAWSSSLGLFVALNGSANIYYSSDGTTWNYVTKTGNIRCVAWSDDLVEFVALGTNCAYSSPDGTTWTSRTVTAKVWVDVDYSPSLGLFAAVANTGEIVTSDDAHTWTDQTVPNSNLRYGIAWSEYNAQFLAVAQSGTGNRLLYSSDGETWTEGTTGTDGAWYAVCWGESAHSWVVVATSGSVELTYSLESIAEDHTITRGDVVLLKDGVTLKFMWRDEAGTVHTDGSDSSLIHNLGYLESTDSPPASYASNERGRVTVGIHLKYKTGDIFKLAINSSQHSQYFGKVTEILDTHAKIGWRCEIELIDRFENTNGGALPSTIERISAYTPLVTTAFDKNLDATVNNLQALADAVDDLDLGGPGTQAEIYDADAKTSLADSDLFALLDSANSYVLKNITYTNIRAILKGYFDALYSADTHTHDGWIAIADAWTRTGTHTFTVPGNVTGQDEYQPGVKIKVTNGGGTVYGVIKSTAYTTLTTITLFDNDDYSLSTGTMTSPHVSYIEAPPGWPDWFNWTPSITGQSSMTISGVTINWARWKVAGHTVYYNFRGTGTVGGTGATFFYVDLPADFVSNNFGTCVAGAADGGSQVTGLGVFTGSTTPDSIGVAQYDRTNFTPGNTCILAFECFYNFV